MREKTVKFTKPNVVSNHNCKASIPRLFSHFQSEFKKNITFEDRCFISFLIHPRTNHIHMIYNFFFILYYVSHSLS